MIVVVDSGVWVSSFQFGGTPLAALRHAYKRHQIAICDQILLEPHSVLLTKFGWSTSRIESAIADYLDNTIVLATPGRIGRICRDPNDDMVFECAILTQAGVILTGDKDLLAIGEYEGIRILTPRAFLDEFAAQADN